MRTIGQIAWLGFVMAVLLGQTVFFFPPAHAFPAYVVPEEAPFKATGDGIVGVLAYPVDPPADVAWPYGGGSDVGTIQSQFNAARSQDPSVSVSLTLPSQASWDAMSDSARALWLVNRERVDRGIAPLAGVESNVSRVAQNYADYLMQTNQFAHDADGLTPWQRLDANPAIGACHDFLNVAENLSGLFGGWNAPVERAIYNWMYDDRNYGWGHRHMILWYPYNDNSGDPGEEGFMGLGRATGTFVYDSTPYPNSDIFVMNVFDPCSTWQQNQINPSLYFLLDN